MNDTPGERPGAEMDEIEQLHLAFMLMFEGRSPDVIRKALQCVPGIVVFRDDHHREMRAFLAKASDMLYDTCMMVSGETPLGRLAQRNIEETLGTARSYIDRAYLYPDYR